MLCHMQDSDVIEEISSFIATNLAEAVEELCGCGFNVSHLHLSVLECDYSKPTHPTYQAFVNANSRYSVADIVGYVEDWVASEPTITVGLVVVSVDSSCPVSPALDDEFCTFTGESSCSSSVLSGVIISEFLVLVSIFFVISAIYLVVSSRTKKRKG